MKATKYFKKTGQSLAKISLTFTITSEQLISSTIDLISMDRKVTKKSIEEHLRLSMLTRGTEVWDYQEENWEKSEYNELKEQAEKKVKEFYPDFFKVFPI